MLLKQSRLFFQFISLPQSQPVKLFHGHTEHLDKLFWGQVALEKHIIAEIKSQILVMVLGFLWPLTYFQSGSVYIFGQPVAPSGGDDERLIGVNLQDKGKDTRTHFRYPGTKGVEFHYFKKALLCVLLGEKRERKWNQCNWKKAC